MTAFFLVLFARLSLAEVPGPVVTPSITLQQIARQRALVAQALESSKAQDQKVADLDKQLSGNIRGDSGAEQAGQAASSTQLKTQLDSQAQLLAQLQQQRDQATQEQATDYLSTQDQIIATQVDSQQELKQVQAQLDLQTQTVAQLAQSIQSQQATHIESPQLEDAINQYQQQSQRLNQLQTLKDTLAVQAAQAQMQSDFNQNQTLNNAKANAESLQSQYAQAERTYQQLQESYQLALAKDEANRKKTSDLDDDYPIQKQKQIALNDTYVRESRKLEQMIKDFSKQ